MSTLLGDPRTGAVDEDEGGPIRRVTWVAARREARLLLRHPLVAVGVLLSGLGLGVLAWAELPELPRFSAYTGLGLAPLAAAALLAAGLNTGRARRDGTDELYDTLGATRRQQTTSRLLGALAILPLGVAIVGVWTAGLYLSGGAGAPNLLELATGPVVVTLGAVTGVTVATWAPTRLAGLLALVTLATFQVTLHDAHMVVVPGLDGTTHWLALWHVETWMTAGDTWIRPSARHLAYLAGLVAAVAALGRLRHRPLGGPAVAGLAALALAMTAGWTQLRTPTDEQVEALFAQIEHPEEFWTCQQRDAITYCVFPTYTRWVDAWHGVVAATLDPVPAGSRPALRVEQHRHPFLSQVIGELGPRSPRGLALSNRSEAIFFAQETAGGWAIRTGETFPRGETFSLALAAAVRVVDLPVDPTSVERRLSADQYREYRATRLPDGPGGAPPEAVDVRVVEELPDGGALLRLPSSCRPDGQAREVLALWLAGRANPQSADRIKTYRAQLLAPLDVDSTYHFGFELPHGNFLPLPDPDLIPGGTWVRWSAPGVDLAAQLLERSRGDVAAVLAADWERWISPATSSDALVDAFDLQAPITGAEYFRRVGLDPDRYPGWVAAVPGYPGDATPPCT